MPFQILPEQPHRSSAQIFPGSMKISIPFPCKVCSQEMEQPRRRTPKLCIWMEKAERAGGILHHHMSERLVKEQMNPLDLLKNLEERINLKNVSKMVIAMNKLGRISLAESNDITD